MFVMLTTTNNDIFPAFNRITTLLIKLIACNYFHRIFSIFSHGMTLTPMNKRLTDPMECKKFFGVKISIWRLLKKFRFNKSCSFIRLQDFGFNQAYNNRFYSFLKGLSWPLIKRPPIKLKPFSKVPSETYFL